MRDEEAIASMGDKLRYAPQGGANYRLAGRKRLEHNQWSRLEPPRRHHEHVDGIQKLVPCIGLQLGQKLDPRVIRRGPCDCRAIILAVCTGACRNDVKLDWGSFR